MKSGESHQQDVEAAVPRSALAIDKMHDGIKIGGSTTNLGRLSARPCHFRSSSIPPMADDDIFDRLMSELHRRATELPEGSYTTKLIRGGIPKMASKILEEAHEVIEAAGEPDQAGKEHTVREACDVIYHLWVLLASRGIDVNALRRELERREGVSGIEEKRRRGQENVS